MNENEIYAVEETNEVDVIELEETGEVQYRQPRYAKKILIATGVIGAIAGAIALKNRERIKNFRRKQALKYLKKTGGLDLDDVGTEVEIEAVEVEDDIDVAE